MDLTNPHNLSNVLSLLSANDTETIKNGEKLLKPFLKKSNCVRHLLTQIQHSPDVNIRHHAALLLKKKIGLFFSKFKSNEQIQLKTDLITSVVIESAKPVATAIAGSIASLAKHIFQSGGTWDELFGLLISLQQDPMEAHRALTYNLLSQMSEQLSSHLKPHTATLAQMFIVGCQDGSHSVAMAALEACGAFINSLGNESEVMLLGSTIVPMLEVMHKCLLNGDEEIVSEGLDVMQECCYLEQPLINDHIENLSRFSMGIIQAPNYDTAVKQSAGQTMMNIIELRPKLFAKKQLVGPTLATLMEMIAKEDPEATGALFTFTNPKGILDDEESKDDDDESYSPEVDVQRLSQTIIDWMAMYIPSKYFVEPALTLCSQGVHSPDPQMRKAGCAVLGVICEGCHDQVTEKLPDILPRLLELLQDSEYYVREAACFTLGQFSEYCQPDILHYNSVVLPAIFQALDDTRQTVQSSSCYVLEMFCENLRPETLRPYLTPLMTKLAVLLQSEQKSTKEMSLSAIAACALSAETDFLPFSEPICNMIGHLIFETEPSSFELRGRALECLGQIAVAIGKDHFSRYFADGMRSAIQGTTLNYESLKEHSFLYIANTAKVMKKDFENFLPTLVPYLLQVISESEIIIMPGGDNDEDEEEEDEDAENDGNGDTEDDEDSGDYRLNIQEGFINSKKAALTALGALAQHTEELFSPYIEDTIKALLTQGIGAINSLHGIIRGEAYLIMQFLVTSACAASNISPNPAYGVILPLPPVVTEISRVVFNANITCLISDEEKLPVSSSLDSIIGVLTTLGLAALHLPDNDGNPMAGPLMNGVLTLLSEKSACQTIDKLENEEDEDDEDHDDIVMDSVTDLVTILAQILRENFVTYFDEFHKPLLKFTKPSRAYTDRSMVIGCYAEVFEQIGVESMKYVPAVLPICKNGLSDTMEGVRRNSAFCIGVLVEAIGLPLSSEFIPLLQLLHPLCSRKENQKASDAGGADIDNALSTVCKMIKVGSLNTPNLVPIPHVLPVILNSLPLRDDLGEGPVVYECIASLLNNNDPTAQANLPNILSLYAETLLPSSRSNHQTKVIVATNLKHLSTLAIYQSSIIAALSQISNPDLVTVIQQAISS
eukprot:gene4790-6717_t